MYDGRRREGTTGAEMRWDPPGAGSTSPGEGCRATGPSSLLPYILPISSLAVLISRRRRFSAPC